MSPFIPLMSIHPSLPVLFFFSKGWHCSGGQSPGRLTQQGVRFGTVLVKSGVQCLGFSFLPKKKKIRKKEKKENKKKYRTASAWPDGKDCRRPHTHTHSHIHPCMVQSSLNSTRPNILFVLVSLNRTERTSLACCCIEP